MWGTRFFAPFSNDATTVLSNLHCIILKRELILAKIESTYVTDNCCSSIRKTVNAIITACGTSDIHSLRLNFYTNILKVMRCDTYFFTVESAKLAHYSYTVDKAVFQQPSTLYQ